MPLCESAPSFVAIAVAPPDALSDGLPAAVAPALSEVRWTPTSVPKSHVAPAGVMHVAPAAGNARRLPW
jgi:hypothetical protein